MAVFASTTSTRRSTTDVAPARKRAMPTLARQVLNLMRERRDDAKHRARLRWELQQYSDRALADMGMARSDIEDVVHGRFAN